MNSFFSIYLVYCNFNFIIVYFSNFRGGKSRGSMDLVHGGGPSFVLSQLMPRWTVVLAKPHYHDSFRLSRKRLFALQRRYDF